MLMERTPLSLRNIKYTRMHHFEKRNSKIFSLEGPNENVWRSMRMFPQASLWLLMGLATDSTMVLCCV